MKPTEFEEQNCVLRGPEGEDVGDLPCHVGADCVVSVWTPTREELAEINATGRVYLMIMGQTHAPVFVAGCKDDVFFEVSENVA
ncbi:hypothetical protein [Candidatus Macondimonas diazotrophica]|jgi:hypothetical protein|uniref:Uncharacterized protein n=1 Tax=Candidatus Macondimonas diazotrophica TaxID=2305248 RepID=A0A4Z0F7I7_9GAMM|nr:hypothetical protein [Candidatus Macondimonas diazotrophica]TFZ81637.1 hypothetical protein E4680_11685 [Candidatus Macondimonas diazotrophica]